LLGRECLPRLSALGLVFIAELPDKTALAALVLATRFRLRSVLVGAWAALALQTVIASVAGSLLHLLPARPIHVVTGIGFLAFAVVALREEAEKEAALFALTGVVILVTAFA
jgi:putative Ca2+/H+ antiporter (TMEM165/GDT1 family)